MPQFKQRTVSPSSGRPPIMERPSVTPSLSETPSGAQKSCLASSLDTLRPAELQQEPLVTRPTGHRALCDQSWTRWRQ